MFVSENKVYVRQSLKTNQENQIYVNALKFELFVYGVVLSQELQSALLTLSTDRLIKTGKKLLSKYTMGKLTTPLFGKWEERKSFNFVERVIQVGVYIFNISPIHMSEPDYVEQLLQNQKKKVVINTVLELATEEAAINFVKTTLTSTMSLSRETLTNFENVFEQIIDLVNYSENYIKSNELRVIVAKILFNISEKTNIQRQLDDELPIEEIRKKCLNGTYKSGLTLDNILKTLKCSPSDALRFVISLSDITKINLPADVIYPSLKWKVRLELLAFLCSFDYEVLLEEMGNNREAWFRFFNHIHIFNQKSFIRKFHIVVFSAYISCGKKVDSVPRQYAKLLDDMEKTGVIEITNSGNLVYRTFASRVLTALDYGDTKTICQLMEKRPNYLFRNFATVLRGVHKNEHHIFARFVEKLLPKASNSVLFSLLSINAKAKYRIIDVKGDTVIEDANYPAIIDVIKLSIQDELKRRYGVSGKIIVENNLKDKILPFLSKNSNLERGTKIKFDTTTRYLYLYVHWVQQNQRTDLDLSVVRFDDRFAAETVYFRNQVDDFIKHSGDITDAPAPYGATEYVRVDLSKLKKHNLKYLFPCVNVYTGSVFNENKEAYVGFYLSNDNKFNLNGDFFRYDLTEPANSNIAFMVDFDNNEVVLLDVNNRQHLGLTVHSEIENMKKIISAVNDKTFVSYQMLADILSGDDDEISCVFATSEGDSIKTYTPETIISLFNM